VLTVPFDPRRLARYVLKASVQLRTNRLEADLTTCRGPFSVLALTTPVEEHRRSIWLRAPLTHAA
jgi:hypothetical protein